MVEEAVNAAAVTKNKNDSFLSFPEKTSA